MRLFKKLSMISRREIIFIILIPIFLGCSGQNNQKINIVFDKPPTLKKEQEFISNISSLALNKNLSKFLKDQNWVNSFLIKKHAYEPMEIFIETREPKYIWREKFYLDNDLSRTAPTNSVPVPSSTWCDRYRQRCLVRDCCTCTRAT